MSEYMLLPDVPRRPLRYQVTVTLPRPDRDEALLLPGGQAAAELAAAAIEAHGLLTAWTCTQSVVSMIVKLPSIADALAAGAAVAQVLEGGDGMASVTAEPVATGLRLRVDALCDQQIMSPPIFGCPETIVTGRHRRAACRRAFPEDQHKETHVRNLCQQTSNVSPLFTVPAGTPLLTPCRAAQRSSVVRHPCAMSCCSGGMCWGLVEDETAGHGVTRGCHLGVVLP